MAQWQVSPVDKKSIEEHEIWEKDGMAIRRITGFRTGTWIVTTDDHKLPNFEFQSVPFGTPDKDSIDFNNACDNNIEDVEVDEVEDCWYDDVIWPDDMDEDERDRLAELWDDDSYTAWEQDGWINTDTQMWVWGDLKIEPVDDR